MTRSRTSRDRYPIPWVLPWATGRWYPMTTGGPLTTGTSDGTAFRANPHFVPNPAGVTVTSIGVEVTTAGTAGHTCRFGLYYDRNGHPGDLILDAGTVTVDATGFRSVATSQYLAQGWVWVAFVAQSGTYRLLGGEFNPGLFGVDQTSDTTTSYKGYFVTDGNTNTVGFPEVYPMRAATTNSATVPRVMLGI